jgi:hypothetical protein
MQPVIEPTGAHHRQPALVLRFILEPLLATTILRQLLKLHTITEQRHVTVQGVAATVLSIPATEQPTIVPRMFLQ